MNETNNTTRSIKKRVSIAKLLHCVGGPMTLSTRRTKITSALVFTLVYMVGSLVFSDVRAEQQVKEGDTINIEELTEKIKQEVMKELREGDFLRKEIDIGIQRYIEKQRKAQRDARAKQARVAKEKAKNVRRVSKQRDHIYGNPAAELSLIEYSDFECPYCKTFHKTVKPVVDTYGGRVNWVYRHFPLSNHNPGAQKQAEASECANELGGNEAFWKYTNAIYARTKSNGKGFPINKLVPLAKEIGLDETEFQSCLNSGRYTERVQEDLREGSQIGITGTPGNILLNNETGEVTVIKGAKPASVLKANISRMLEKKK
jgi:protein-disulfide isomerase